MEIDNAYKLTTLVLRIALLTAAGYHVHQRFFNSKVSGLIDK